VVRTGLPYEPRTCPVPPLRRGGGRLRRPSHGPRSGIAIGLHHHDANPGQLFHESQTGLDHISFGVADRTDLDAWAAWLDELGIEHSGVIDTDNPVPYSVIVFRDPDNIQLELCYIAS
jgi:catechol 2,3-dioxygenase-like lactoylglutathione lyase family enzyme